MRFRLLSAVVLLAICPLRLDAAEAKGQTFTEPEQAGPDFAIQGEYAGDEHSVQVIALGEGKFQLIGWKRGLPGTSSESEQRGKFDATTAEGKITFAGDGWKGTIGNGDISATHEDGRTGKIQKTERKSPTLGAKPPGGATVLFDGTSAEAWQGGKVDERGFLNCGVKTKEKFGDFTLHLEFRTPFMPAARGQGRGNSGVYLQDRYELQILDSFGLSGENNECGGIYTIAKPRVNMCFPPLSWQTYDIDFVAAKFDDAGKKTANAMVTIKHNGVVIHDRVELPKSTGGGIKEGPEPGPIQLQDHGNPVVFRNIWVAPKK